MRMGWLGGCVLTAMTAMAGAQGVTPVAKLDFEKFTGTWYQMARLPTRAEKRCASDGLMLYALANKPGRFEMVSSCVVKDDFRNIRNQNGKAADKSGDGKLKVRTIFPFSEKHWVLALGPEYDWAIVGNPNHKQLWLLTRAMRPDAGVVEQMKTQAAAEGFNVSKLVAVVQSR